MFLRRDTKKHIIYIKTSFLITKLIKYTRNCNHSVVCVADPEVLPMGAGTSACLCILRWHCHFCSRVPSGVHRACRMVERPKMGSLLEPCLHGRAAGGVSWGILHGRVAVGVLWDVRAAGGVL